ncbi:hypothetical protein PVAP13_8KG318800 [Panicum virgatum]|uniref:LRAT domain-containing protein n=1 Tax=Panicum virgatum TaxID=38727 RepID=A0A8T0PWK0_PANVG|nr:hypothetical protein PVAP13_8KG318800 [Panicum virgatum]
MDRGVTLFSRCIDRSQLKSGDHIYTWRKRAANTYAHHGIYVNDKKVIEYCAASTCWVGFSSPVPARLCRECSLAERTGGVVFCCLDCFLEGGSICLFAYSVTLWFYTMSNNIHFQPQLTCLMAAEDSTETVLRRANELLTSGDFGSYNVFTNNCTHFAVYCKTGCRYSFPTISSLFSS